MDDRLTIGAPDNIKQKVIALIAFSPLCLIDWGLEWLGLGTDEPKYASMFIIAAWVLAFIGMGFEAYTQYTVDKYGVTRTIFKRFVTFIPWGEMKYIGDCIDTPDWQLSIGGPHNHVMLFSRVPYTEYMRFHIIIHRLIETRNVISIRYIDDETYEKILEFSGGERNIP